MRAAPFWHDWHAIFSGFAARVLTFGDTSPTSSSAASPPLHRTDSALKLAQLGPASPVSAFQRAPRCDWLPGARSNQPVGRCAAFAAATGKWRLLRKDAVNRVCSPGWPTQVSAGAARAREFSHERVHAVRRDEPAHQQILLVLRQSIGRRSSASARLRRSPSCPACAATGPTTTCARLGAAAARADRAALRRTAAAASLARSATTGCRRLRRRATPCHSRLRSPATARMESGRPGWRRLRTRARRRSRSLRYARGHESVRGDGGS